MTGAVIMKGDATVNKGSTYYTLAVWRFKPFLSIGLRVHWYLSGGLRFTAVVIEWLLTTTQDCI